MVSIIECYDSAYTYISEIDNDENINPLDNKNTGTFDKFIGAYVGCIIGSAINKVINKVINKPIDDIQLQTIDDFNNN